MRNLFSVKRLDDPSIDTLVIRNSDIYSGSSLNYKVCGMNSKELLIIIYNDIKHIYLYTLILQMLNVLGIGP